MLVSLQSSEAFSRFLHGRRVQRIAIEAERHRFTFRQTRRTVPITFSMILVQASERRSSFGSLSRGPNRDGGERELREARNAIGE